jgi:hypothetical protein
MMDIQTAFTLTETTAVSALTIGSEGKLLAPEGKLLTMTVDGIQTEIVPGTYAGDIRLYVTDYIPAPIEGMHAKAGDPPEPYRAALLLGKDGPEENAAAAAYVGGSVEGKTVQGGSIVSRGECFNDLIITGGQYTVRDLTIENTGHSVDDGKGLGAGILAGGDSETLFENLTVQNQGIRNDAIVTGGTAKITVKNSNIACVGGTPEQIQAVHKVRPGKACMTYVSGGWGTTRAVNVQNDSSAYFENCTIQSDSWGVLSTDGISSPKEFHEPKTRIYAKDCDVELTGHHGYGSYSIGDCTNIFDHTRMYAPDVAYKVANELAGGQFINGSEIIGGRFGVMWQSNQGGRLIVKDSTIRSGRSTFIARSCFPNIYCENATLEAGNRVILQMFDSDDPGFGKPEVEVDTEVPVKDPEHGVTGAQFHPLSIWGFQQEQWCTDLQATFKDMTIVGDFYNGTTNAKKPMMMPMPKPDGEKPAGGPPAGGPGGPGAPGGAPGGMPAGMPPMNMKNYPINLVLTLDHVELEGVVSASRAQHSVKKISGSNRKEIYQVYDTPSPVVNNGVILTLKNGTKWTITGHNYLSALHVDETSTIRTPDGCDVELIVNGQEIPYAPGDYEGDIFLRAKQLPTPAMF